MGLTVTPLGLHDNAYVVTRYEPGNWFLIAYYIFSFDTTEFGTNIPISKALEGTNI